MKIKSKHLFLLVIFLFTVFAGGRIFLQMVYPAKAQSFFRFVSWGDAQDNGTNLPKTSQQAGTFNPNFTIFNGDLEQDGVVASQLTTEINAMNSGSAGMFARTFPVRGNHDNHQVGSDVLWQNFFKTMNKPLPSGATNYVGMDANSTYLTFSFDYGNARFIGVDVPGNAVKITTAQITFVDGRLTDAENKGLIHAFIYFHGPLYCAALHCGCTAKTDGSCTPGGLINVINKHPIVSATFHGHEHLLSWTHINNTRVPGVTHQFEQFITSPSGSGSTYNSTLNTARVDYASLQGGQAFATVDVNGASFTVNLYRVGTTAPVWTKAFTKTGGYIPPTSTIPVFTPTRTPTSGNITPTRTRTPTPITSTPTKTRTPTQFINSPTPPKGSVCTYFLN